MSFPQSATRPMTVFTETGVRDSLYLSTASTARQSHLRQVRKQTNDLLRSRRARKIILDCDCLDFATSLGLGTLVRAAMRVNRESGEVVLCNVRGILAELVQVSQLGRLMHIYPDVDDAAKKLTGS